MTKSTATFLAACLLGLAFGVGPPAYAEEIPAPQKGRGVICDTLEQAQAFMDTWDGTNAEAAVQVANGSLPSDEACGFAFFLFYQGAELAALATHATGSSWTFHEIAVVGYCNQAGLCRPSAEPELQYTAVPGPIVGTSI